jgi:hypothetical protein
MSHTAGPQWQCSAGWPPGSSPLDARWALTVVYTAVLGTKMGHMALTRMESRFLKPYDSCKQGHRLHPLQTCALTL